VKVVKGISIVALLVAAWFWAQHPPYEVILRFIVAGGAVVVGVQAFHARHYAFAAGFAALALLYNPIAPVFSFSGVWQLALVIATAIPFAVSFARPNIRLAPRHV
jgi:low affinity Fe/Cu permease